VNKDAFFPSKLVNNSAVGWETPPITFDAKITAFQTRVDDSHDWVTVCKPLNSLANDHVSTQDDPPIIDDDEVELMEATWKQPKSPAQVGELRNKVEMLMGAGTHPVPPTKFANVKTDLIVPEDKAASDDGYTEFKRIASAF